MENGAKKVFILALVSTALLAIALSSAVFAQPVFHNRILEMTGCSENVGDMEIIRFEIVSQMDDYYVARIVESTDPRIKVGDIIYIRIFYPVTPIVSPQGEDIGSG